ncbi:hypothetical protein BBJ28_00016899 [Nothophytophthora sp. Chile5]|nr:hypothetical protein BBJ28_00016899 [Nothophytophthora sp. Chile5]
MEDSCSSSNLLDETKGGVSAAKRLDMPALHRLCMSEQLLSRLRQPQQRNEEKRFQHVEAKFNGSAIEGGLGTVCFVAQDGERGVAWLQTLKTDPNAQDRRKKELQDITNRRSPEADANPISALFVALQDVAKAKKVAAGQNAVHGIELELCSGHRLELTFMPAVDARMPSSRTALTSHTAEEKEEFRRLVRRYTQLDELSVEAVAIAKQLHEKTGYHVGPIARECPKFSADMKYRKKTVTELSNFLKRMNQEWNDADTQRELHTKVKYSRNEDELFEYRDTETGALISTQMYEMRYLEYVKAHEVEAVLHLCPVPARVTRKEEPVRGNPATTTAPAGAVASGTPSSPTEVEKCATAVFMATLGIDISSSLVIDQEMLAPRVIKPLADVPAQAREDATYRTAVDKARVQLWERLGDAFASIREPLSAERRQRIADAISVGSVEARAKSERLASHGKDSAQKPRRKMRRQSIVNVVTLPKVWQEQKKPSCVPIEWAFVTTWLPKWMPSFLLDQEPCNKVVTFAHFGRRFLVVSDGSAVKARLKEDALVEEEDQFLSLTKPLSERRVQAAATRNYEVASELRWKKLMQQAIAEQRQLNEELAQCTFRPQLAARRPARAPASSSSKPIRNCRCCQREQPAMHQLAPARGGGSSGMRCGGSGPSDEASLVPRGGRLCRAARERPAEPTGERMREKTRGRSFGYGCMSVCFLTNSTWMQRKRQELAAQQRFSHTPTLSRRTQELCAVLRERSREELQDPDRNDQRHLPRGRSEELKKTKLPLHKTNASINSVLPPHPSILRHASMPFDALVAALQVQEQRMRGLSKCA